MGRWSYSNRSESDQLKKVEIWWLKKYGYLDGWKSGGISWRSNWDDNKSSISIAVSTGGDDEYIEFWYTQTDYYSGEKKDFHYKARLTSTPCNYGGKRFWFICPLSNSGRYCGRRVGVLYKGGDYFGCRHCYDLTYSSRKENRSGGIYAFTRAMTLLDRSEKVREKMKRLSYAGRPTKRFRKFQRISEQLTVLNGLMESKK